MSGDKVKFSPLERLDIVDADALQALIYSYIERAFGSVVGDIGGVLVDNGYTLNTSNSTIIPNDFTFLAKSLTTDITNSVVSRVGLYDANLSGQSVISYLTAKNAVSSYFTTNGSLPPSPSEEGYSDAIYGAYYPYIYARTYRANGESEARRFWSPADNLEVSQSVVVRERQKVSFLTLSPTSSVPTPSGDSSAWTRIGRITSWTTGTYQPTLSWRYLADDSVLDDFSQLPAYVSTRQGEIDRGGLKGVINAIKTIMHADRTNGSSDSYVPTAFAVNTGLAIQPKYSLDALAGLVDSSIGSVVKAKSNNTLQIVYDGVSTLTGTLTSKYAVGNAIRTSAQADPNVRGWTKPIIGFDYSVYLDSPHNGAVGDETSADARYNMYRGFYVEVDSSYLGWVFDVSFNANTYYSSTAETYSGLVIPSVYSTSNPTDRYTIQSITIKNADGTTSTKTGFKVLLATSVINSNYGTGALTLYSGISGIISTSLQGTYRYGFSMDINLYNPSAV
jgi:hypothetical protein